MGGGGGVTSSEFSPLFRTLGSLVLVGAHTGVDGGVGEFTVAKRGVACRCALLGLSLALFAFLRCRAHFPWICRQAKLSSDICWGKCLAIR